MEGDARGDARAARVRRGRAARRFLVTGCSDSSACAEEDSWEGSEDDEEEEEEEEDERDGDECEEEEDERVDGWCVGMMGGKGGNKPGMGGNGGSDTRALGWPGMREEM